MAKFNITVDLDWINEDGSLDEELIEAIKAGVLDRVQAQTFETINSKVQEALDQQLLTVSGVIDQKMNDLMDEFFDRKINVTDQWGDVVQSNTSVRERLKAACDGFLTDTVEEDTGKPAKSSWNKNLVTRADYIVHKAIKRDLEYEITREVDNVVDNLKKQISTTLNNRMSEKLRKVVGVDELIEEL